jgi:hypothetical protein
LTRRVCLVIVADTGVTKDSHLVEYDAEHYLVKEEMTHFGTKKIILKNKKSGKIIERIGN